MSTVPSSLRVLQKIALPLAVFSVGAAAYAAYPFATIIATSTCFFGYTAKNLMDRCRLFNKEHGDSVSAEEIYPLEPAAKPQSGSQSAPASLDSHNEFIKRIKKEERELIRNKISEMEKIYTLTDKDIDDIKKGNWTAPLFKISDWCFLAFKAYLSRKIEQKHLIKSLLFFSCKQEAEIFKSYQLFSHPDGENKDALTILRNSLGKHFSNEQFERLLEMMRSIPPEDTQFFGCRFKENGDWLMGDIAAISRDFLVDVNKTLRETQYEFLYLPPSLIHYILKIKHADKTILPIPVLGYSDVERFSDFTRRVVFIPSPFCQSPQRLHGGPIKNSTSIYFHDAVYHSAVESAIPHRSIWVELAKIISSSKKIRLLDRDFPIYAFPIIVGGRKITDPNLIFWITLEGVYRKELEPDDRLKILNYLNENTEQMKQKYGLSISNIGDFLAQGITDLSCEKIGKLECFYRLIVSNLEKKQIANRALCTETT